MYYSYGDAQKMRHMLKQSAEENGTSKEQMQHNTDSLNAMVRCCCNTLGLALVMRVAFLQHTGRGVTSTCGIPATRLGLALHRLVTLLQAAL